MKRPASIDAIAPPALAATATSLRAWGEGTIEQGVEQVEQQLERLRQAGAVDDAGQRRVDLPADMKPGSATDV